MTPKPDASPAALAEQAQPPQTEPPAIDQATAPIAQREYLDDSDFVERKAMPILDVFLPGKKKWAKFQVLTSRELEEINTLHRETIPVLDTLGQPTGETTQRIRQEMYPQRIMARAACRPDGRRIVVGELDPGVILYAEKIADSWLSGDIIAVTDKLMDAMGLSSAAMKRLGKG